MIFPTTPELTLMLAVVAMLCWGLWANTLKLSNWRFELYYFDFAIGVILTGTVLAFTAGSMGDELSFWDNLQIAGKRQMAMALAAGFVFNLGNMLLIAATSIGGMATSFAIAGGVALVVALAWSRMDTTPALSLPMAGVSITLFLISAVLAALAHLASTRKPAAAPEEPVSPALAARRRLGATPRGSTGIGAPTKTVGLAVVAGLFLGSFRPLLEGSAGDQIGLGPYPLVFLMGIGIMISTIIYNLYFMNLPVEGSPVQFFRYLQGSVGQHFMGLAGGAMWSLGAVALNLVLNAPRQASIANSALAWLSNGGTLVAIVCGVLLWKEFKGAPSVALGMLGLMALLFAGGVAVLANPS